MKKIFLLLWFVLLGLFEVQAYQFEKNGIYYDIVNGKAVVVSGDVSYSGDVVIPETVEYDGQHYVVDSIGEWAFNSCSGLMSVKLPEKLRAIGSLAFVDCYGLTSISFPTSLKVIGYGAFSECKGLVSVVFPEGLTEIRDGAFTHCDKLDSLSFPASMEAINWNAFCENDIWAEHDITCKHIRYVDVKDLRTWVNSERLLENEWHNHHLKVPYAQLYLNGKLLKEAIVPEGVEDIKPYTFYGVDSLTSVKLPSSVRSIGDSAFNQRNVEVVFASAIPPVRGSIGSLGEENLLYVPEEAIEAYRTAWSDKVNDILCLGRQHDWDVTVEAEDKSSAVLQAVGGVSDNEAARNVVRLKVSGTVNSYDFMVMRNKMTCLRELDLTDAHVVYNPYEHYQGYHSWNDSLPDYAFYRKDLRVCRLPQNIVYIGRNAFSRCSRLTDMDIPEKVQEIGDAAFEGCI